MPEQDGYALIAALVREILAIAMTAYSGASSVSGP